MCKTHSCVGIATVERRGLSRGEKRVNEDAWSAETNYGSDAWGVVDLCEHVSGSRILQKECSCTQSLNVMQAAMSGAMCMNSNGRGLGHVCARIQCNR